MPNMQCTCRIVILKMIKQNARIMEDNQTVGIYITVDHYAEEIVSFLNVVSNYRKATFLIENDDGIILSGSKDRKDRWW